MKKLMFKVKTVIENDELFIEGFAVKYNVVDSTRYKDKLLYGCCTKTLKENKSNIKLLFEHDRARVIGKIVNYEDSFEGLFIKAKISEAEPEIKTKISEGLYDSFSIGFIEIKSTPIFDDNRELVENQITEIKLIEVSLVSFPAYKQAKFSVTKSMQELIEKENDFENETQYLEKIKSLISEPIHSHEPIHSESKPININVNQLIEQLNLN